MGAGFTFIDGRGADLSSDADARKALEDAVKSPAIVKVD